MNNSITIQYPSSNSEPIEVHYTVEQSKELQTINCRIARSGLPAWLQLRKFSISSIRKQGIYTVLFSEINNSRNMDTSLFIDFVYRSIMKLENYVYL